MKNLVDLVPYSLVMTYSSPWKSWPIEIDGLPFLKMVDLSMAMLNNQMVIIWCQYAHMRWIQMQRSVRRRKQPHWFGHC
jgi:hypothetical protein